MVYIEASHTKPIYHLIPHYTDGRFATAQTVYLSGGTKLARDGYARKAEYNYSDRLMQWHGFDKHEAARATATQSGYDVRSAAFCEAYLRALLEKPELQLVHIMAGFNLATGYPYQVYGYITE